MNKIRQMRARSGLTLVECVIAVAIFSLVTLAAFTMYTPIVEISKKVRADNDMARVVRSAEAYITRQIRNAVEIEIIQSPTWGVDLANHVNSFAGGKRTADDVPKALILRRVDDIVYLYDMRLTTSSLIPTSSATCSTPRTAEINQVFGPLTVPANRAALEAERVFNRSYIGTVSLEAQMGLSVNNRRCNGGNHNVPGLPESTQCLKQERGKTYFQLSIGAEREGNFEIRENILAASESATLLTKVGRVRDNNLLQPTKGADGGNCMMFEARFRDYVASGTLIVAGEGGMHPSNDNEWVILYHNNINSNRPPLPIPLEFCPEHPTNPRRGASGELLLCPDCAPVCDVCSAKLIAGRPCLSAKCCGIKNPCPKGGRAGNCSSCVQRCSGCEQVPTQNGCPHKIPPCIFQVINLGGPSPCAAGAHVWRYESDLSPIATCVAVGRALFRCQNTPNCDSTAEFSTPVKPNHDWGEWIEMVLIPARPGLPEGHLKYDDWGDPIQETYVDPADGLTKTRNKLHPAEPATPEVRGLGQHCMVPNCPAMNQQRVTNTNATAADVVGSFTFSQTAVNAGVRTGRANFTFNNRGGTDTNRWVVNFTIPGGAPADTTGWSGTWTNTIAGVTFTFNGDTLTVRSDGTTSREIKARSSFTVDLLITTTSTTIGTSTGRETGLVCTHTFAPTSPLQERDAACTTPAQALFTCSQANCFAAEWRTAPVPDGVDPDTYKAQGHLDTGAAATCLTPQVCARVGCSFIIAHQRGHDLTAFGPTTPPQPATCVAAGREIASCTRAGCTQIIERSQSALKHQFSDGAGGVTLHGAFAQCPTNPTTHHVRTCVRAGCASATERFPHRYSAAWTVSGIRDVRTCMDDGCGYVDSRCTECKSTGASCSSWSCLNPATCNIRNSCTWDDTGQNRKMCCIHGTNAAARPVRPAATSAPVTTPTPPTS